MLEIELVAVNYVYGVSTEPNDANPDRQIEAMNARTGLVEHIHAGWSAGLDDALDPRPMMGTAMD
ncbi:MAG: hypothetical protein ACF8LL_09440 [Phycisphaerales bacterium]